MKCNHWEVFPIHAGTFALDGGAMFGIIPKPLWEKNIPADDKNRISLALRTMLITNGKTNILVDTGIGNKWSEKEIQIYKIENWEHSLQNDLKKYGLTAENIHHVILTHLHFDHAGGALKLNNDGNIVPTFCNAKYYISRKNYQWALSPSEKDAGSYLKRDFQWLLDNNTIIIYEENDPLFEGISCINSDGHTIGQKMVKVDGKRSIVFCGDVIPTQFHIPLPYIMGYDLQPLIIMEEKKRLFQQAAEENWILFLEHDPYTCAASIKKEKEKYVRDQIYYQNDF